MNPTSRRILAIDPGTREIGIAVLENEELIHFAVKTIKDRSTAQKILQQAATIIGGLIATFRPQYLAIEKIFIVQKSAALLSVVAEEMKATARASGLQIHEYAPTAVRRFLCNSGRATKLEVAKIVASRFRELARHLNSQTKWEAKYYANIFDAVAVGLRCNAEISNSQLPFQSVNRNY